MRRVYQEYPDHVPEQESSAIAFAPRSHRYWIYHSSQCRTLALCIGRTCIASIGRSIASS